MAIITSFIKSFESKVAMLETDASSTLRTPISRERNAERAVDRFMKLIQAMTCITPAINNNIYRKDGLIVLLISTS